MENVEIDVQTEVTIKLCVSGTKIPHLVKGDLYPGNELLCIRTAESFEAYINPQVVYTISAISLSELSVIDNDLNESGPSEFSIERLCNCDNESPVFISWTNLDPETKTMLKLKYKIQTAEEANS